MRYDYQPHAPIHRLASALAAHQKAVNQRLVRLYQADPYAPMKRPDLGTLNHTLHGVPGNLLEPLPTIVHAFQNHGKHKSIQDYQALALMAAMPGGRGPELDPLLSRGLPGVGSRAGRVPRTQPPTMFQGPHAARVRAATKDIGRGTATNPHFAGPPGLSFRHATDGNLHKVEAHLDGKKVGHITHKEGVIEDIVVHPKLYRQGIGTALFHEAKRVVPHLKHSKELSDDAVKWIAGMKEKQMKHGRSY